MGRDELIATKVHRTQQAQPALVDGFGRHITYLRLSITDRCDMRCLYCMGEDATFLPRKELMSSEELIGIAHMFIDRGIRTIRLTGGEPLTRRDCVAVARGIGERLGSGLDALTMTTNASQLDRHANALAEAGIRRINISIDTLDAADFRAITRGGDLLRVLSGVRAAQDAGLAVRINMVAMAGVNDRQLPAMVDWCEVEGFDLALIESMPMGAVGGERASTHVSLSQFIAPLLNGAAPLDLPHRTAGPARYISLPGRALRIGLITPISNNFCSSCNRIRMSADGKVHACLGHDDAYDFASAFRNGGAAAVAPLLDRLMASKAERHEFRIAPGQREQGPLRRMHATGG